MLSLSSFVSVTAQVPRAVGEGGLLPQQIYTFPHTTKEVELLWLRTAWDQVVKWFRGTVCCARTALFSGTATLGPHCLCASRATGLGLCYHLSAWHKLPKSFWPMCIKSQAWHMFKAVCSSWLPWIGPSLALLFRWAPLLKRHQTLWASTKFCPTAVKLTGKWWSESCSSTPSWTLG